MPSYNIVARDNAFCQSMELQPGDVLGTLDAPCDGAVTIDALRNGFFELQSGEAPAPAPELEPPLDDDDI